MPVFSPSTDQSDIELPEPGKYVLRCVDLTDAPDKGFGPGLKWVFRLIDPESGVTIQSRDGGDYELWQFTSTKLSPKARARPFVEGLLGRALDAANREQPDARQLIGKSMIAMVVHERRDDGSDVARVTSCKPYVSPSTNVVSPPAAPAAAPTAQQPAAGQGTLRDQVTNAVRKAHVLGTPRHLEWLAVPLDTLSDSDLYELLNEINADIAAA